MSKSLFEKSGYWGLYKKNSKIEVCFAHGTSPCSGPILSAHSIQCNGILNQLEDKRKGGNRLYSLEEWILDGKDNIVDLKLVGKKAASIFTGFCKKHDVELFSPIEQGQLHLSPQQLFLFYYRGFAHSHHTVAEQCKFKEYVLKNGDISSADSDTLVRHREYQIEYQVFLEIYRLGMLLRDRLNTMILHRNYTNIKHFYKIIPYKRVACSQRLVPSFTYSGKSLKRWESISQIILNVIPDFDRTIIIFSYLEDDEKGIQFIDELRELPDNEFNHAVSSAMIYSGMNTFFAPDVWDAFTTQQRMSVIRDIEYLSFYGHNHVGFYHSETNLLA